MNHKRPFIPSWLFKQGWNHSQFAVFSYVCMRGECWESKRSIAKALQMDINAFYKNLNVLIEDGWITKSKKGRSSSLRCRYSSNQLMKEEQKNEQAQEIDTSNYGQRHAQLYNCAAKTKNIIRMPEIQPESEDDTERRMPTAWMQ